MSRSTASLFLPVIVLLAVVAAVYTKPWQRSGVGNTGAEITVIQNDLASSINKLEQAYPHKKIVDAVNCTRANGWPSVFRNLSGHAYDCIAIFTNSPAIQRWCALYDTRIKGLGLSYEGVNWCEGPPNPFQEP